MPLETPITYISDLNPSNPTVADGLNQGDDHLRGIKAALQTTFPNLTGAVTGTQAQFNALTAATYPFLGASYAPGSVGTAALADANVTYAKVQNVTAFRLLGNATGTAAAPNEVSLGAGLGFSGAVLQIGPQALSYSMLPNVSGTKLLGNSTGAAASAAEIALGTGLAFSSGSLVFTGAFPASSVVNLLVKNSVGAPLTQIDVTADEAVLVDSSGVAVKHTNVSVLGINSTITGVNGVDVSTRLANTPYDIYLISNGTTVAGLLVVSGANPSLPSGYTFKKRVSWQRTDGSSNFFYIRQRGNRAHYVVQSGGALPSLVAQGSAVSGGVLTTVSLSGFIPASASVALVQGGMLLGSGAQNELLAFGPNANYGSYQTDTTLPYNLVAALSNVTTALSVLGMIDTETLAFVYQTNTSAAFFRCYGWVDSGI